MINAVIIDDEIACAETLAMELEIYCPQVKVLKNATSAMDGLTAIQELRPQLVFLDIEMPWMDGFALLEHLPKIDFEIIFVTAYDHFALRAFKFSAADYLLKPVQKEELIRAVEKARERIAAKDADERMKALLVNVNLLHNSYPTFAVPTIDGIEFIPVEDIVYCAADNNYTFIHQASKAPTLLSRTLKDVESMLVHHPFVRIHQSYIIHLRHLRKYVRGQGGTVILSNHAELPVSRSRKEVLLDRISQM